VDVFPNNNEGEHFVSFLKEAYLLVRMDSDKPIPLDFDLRMDIPDLFDLFIRTVDKTRLFFTNINRSVQESRKPHHLLRYFFLYTTGFIGSITLTLIGFGSSNRIEEGVRRYWNWGTSLIVNHISRPLRRLFSFIFVSNSSSLENDRIKLSKMIAQYPSRKDGRRLNPNKDLQKTEGLDMDLIMDSYTNDIKNVRVNTKAFNMPRLLQGLLIQVQAGKVQNGEIHEQMNEIIYVLSVVPASIAVYGMVSILKRLYHGGSLDIVTYKYRFRRLILQLHSHILGLKDQFSKDSEKIVGKMLQTCERLRLLTYNAVQSSGCYHNINDKKLLEEDLQLFLDFEYDVNQRLRQLARMERFYL